MSTSAVPSSSLYQQLQSYFQTRSSDTQQLGEALSSGNLSAAQTAYNNITTLGQTGPFANGDAFRSTQREQDFTAIGQALQAGDLAGAQQAAAALKATGVNLGSQTTSATAPPTPAAASTPAFVLNLSSGSTTNSAATGTAASNPIAEIVINFNSGAASNAAPAAPVAEASTTGPEIVLNLNDSGSSTNPEQVTIDIGNSSSGGEQVSISSGSQGSASQQVTLNFAGNSNEEIILNFLQGSANTPSTASSTTTSSPTTTGNTTTGAPTTGLSVTA
jgi:hypothetical protein